MPPFRRAPHRENLAALRPAAAIDIGLETPVAGIKQDVA
jgi:hypothetical protein